MLKTYGVVALCFLMLSESMAFAQIQPVDQRISEEQALKAEYNQLDQYDQNLESVKIDKAVISNIETIINKLNGRAAQAGFDQKSTSTTKHNIIFWQEAETFFQNDLKNYSSQEDLEKEILEIDQNYEAKKKGLSDVERNDLTKYELTEAVSRINAEEDRISCLYDQRPDGAPFKFLAGVGSGIAGYFAGFVTGEFTKNYIEPRLVTNPNGQVMAPVFGLTVLGSIALGIYVLEKTAKKDDALLDIQIKAAKETLEARKALYQQQLLVYQQK